MRSNICDACGYLHCKWAYFASQIAMRYQLFPSLVMIVGSAHIVAGKEFAGKTSWYTCTKNIFTNWLRVRGTSGRVGESSVITVMYWEANVMYWESSVMYWEANVMYWEANVMDWEANVMYWEANACIERPMACIERPRSCIEMPMACIERPLSCIEKPMSCIMELNALTALEDVVTR